MFASHERRDRQLSPNDGGAWTNPKETRETTNSNDTAPSRDAQLCNENVPHHIRMVAPQSHRILFSAARDSRGGRAGSPAPGPPREPVDASRASLITARNKAFDSRSDINTTHAHSVNGHATKVLQRYSVATLHTNVKFAPVRKSGKELSHAERIRTIARNDEFQRHCTVS